MMEKSPTPIPTPIRELDKELRDSHVRLKDVPTTEEDWKAIDSESKPSAVEASPALNRSGPRLQLVSITPKEPVPSVDPDPRAEIIPLRPHVKGLVAAERESIAREDEARFHQRDTIEQAVRRSRESTEPPPPPPPSPVASRPRWEPRTLKWLVAALFGVAALVAAAILLWA